VLIIGGGIAGATVAERLGRAGAVVHLIDKQQSIGGHAAEIGCKAIDKCLRCNVCVADDLFRTVRTAPDIHIHTETELQAVQPLANRNGYKATIAPREGGGEGSEIDVDAIVIAIGHEPYDPAENSAYRYGAISNVITGVEAERQLAVTDRITRPSDGKAPKRIAFIQCVGSRTEEIHRRPEDTDYCSTVCCSYALRIGRLLRHRDEAADVTVFYMDIQKFGKGFDALYRECRKAMRFVRSRPYELAAGDDDSVVVTYAPETDSAAEEGGVIREPFDLVVLSVGIRPPADARRLADVLGVPLDDDGFFGLKGARTFPDLQKRGVFVVGTAESPKDIAGSMAQAEAVSALVMHQTGLGPDTASGEPADHDVLVVGGGVSGLRAAVMLGELGYRVGLIHDRDEPGGAASAAPELYAYLDRTAEASVAGVKDVVAGLVRAAGEQANLDIYAGVRPASIQGEAGAFRMTVGRNGDPRVLQARAVVLATGANERPVAEANAAPILGLGALPDLVRSEECCGRVAIVLDTAGEQGRAVWAQVLSAAEQLAERSARVKIYCGSVRVATAGLESLYRRARDAGVVIAKSTAPPAVVADGDKVTVRAEDPIAGVSVTEEFDLAVMADLRPQNCGVADTVERLRVGPDAELQYNNVWLMPGLTNRPGIFVAGGARGNSEFREALTDGLAVAYEVHGLLAGDDLKPRDDVAQVDAEKCVLCLTCMRICPHGAITIDCENEAARPSPVSCRRCGVCVAECPAQAITLPGFTDDEMAAQVGKQPGLVVFACENSAVPAAEDSGQAGEVELIKVPCAGDVDPRMVLSALEKGAEKVLIVGCHPENCRYLSGSSRAEKRSERLVARLEKAGVDRDRVAFRGIASVQAGKFTEYVKV